MATDPDMALSSSLGLANTLIPGGSTGHPYLYDPCYGVASDSTQDTGSGPGPRPLYGALVVTFATEFNADLGFSWTMDPNMAFGSSLARSTYLF